MDYANAFWVSLGGSTTALLVVGSLFTWLIQHRFARAVETHKVDLQKELAKVSSELTMLNKRQEVAFTWLHTNKAQVMVEAYSKLSNIRNLVALLNEMVKTLKSNPKHSEYMVSMEETPAKLSKAVGEFTEYVSEKEIFFDDKLLAVLLQAGYYLAHAGLFHLTNYMATHPETKEFMNTEHIATLNIDDIKEYIDKTQRLVREQFQQVLTISGLTNIA